MNIDLLAIIGFVGLMSALPIPIEVAHALNRLRKEAAEKSRIADELERHYTGRAPGLATLYRTAQRSPDSPSYTGIVEGSEIDASGQTPVPTAEDIKRRIGNHSARVSVLANYFNIPESKIKEIIGAQGSGLIIPDWRGWVKIKPHK